MRKIFGGKALVKYAFLLAIPSMLQQVITALAQLVDNVMVGGLGDNAIAAVGIANQISFVFFFASFGISSACGIFISQYMGTENTKKVQETIRINLILALTLGFIMTFIVITYPEQLVKLFVKDDQHTVDLAVGYLRRVSAIYIMFPLIVTYSFGFRYEGKPKYGLFMAICAVLVNTFLNYCLIYGNFGFPTLGVNGAAYATVASRVVEFTIALIISKCMKTNIYTKITDIFKFDNTLLKAVLSKGWLVVTNEVVWSLSITLLNILYSQKISGNIAALQINGVMLNLAYIGSGGFATAVGVIVGKELGRDNLAEAKKDSVYLIRMSGVFAACVGLVLISVSKIFPSFYDVSDSVASAATILIIISGAFLWIRYLEMATFFVVRSGGDSKGVFIMDSGYMWLFLIPTMFLVTLLDISMIERFVIGNILMLPKALLTYYIYRKETWLRNITV